MDSKSLCDYAQSYLKLGWSVIPINPKNKRPYIKWEPYQNSLPNKSELQDWWTQFPKANIGVITGKISELIVIDVDSKEGREIYTASFNELHNTISQTTGKNGGLHLFFKHPGDKLYHNRAGMLEKVDVRADGGYVIVAPSIHPNGKEYQWQIDPLDMGLDDLMDLPEDVKSKLEIKDETKLRNEEGWVQEALFGVKEGKRTDTLAKLAGYYIRIFEGNAKQAEVLLQDWNLHNDPPLDWKEVTAVVQDIAKREGRIAMGATIGETIDRIQIMKYPDGTRKYKVFLKDFPGFAEMDINQLVIYSQFKLKFAELADRVPRPMKQVPWERMVNKALAEAEVVIVPIDETPIGLVVGLINSEVDAEHSMDNLDYINGRIVIKDDIIYLKTDTILNMITLRSDKLSRKQLGGILRTLGFKSELVRHAGIVVRCWQRALDNDWKQNYR